jgi:hypothetical protein
MSILRSKHNGWTWEMTRTPFMGGGGGGGQAPPTQTTSYSTNVPEYARPYVENMLQSTQKQIYTDDMAGFRPYRPYSTDVNQYFAGFSPMQQQAQQATAQLQTPGQYGTATGLAGLSGLGALGAGQQYAQNVTSPQSMQAYMSPYQQSVTDVAKTAAVREAQMAQQAQNLGAARQGTYGGARQTLAQAEREKNLLSNLSNIQAQGSQSAYDRALQSQQFGANLGLQGYGQAGQAASTLGQLGGQQLGAQKEIIGLQSQMGKEQQALEQNKINQAIQDYAIAQQYPFMQLAQMNAMLRGLPMQTQTTQLYQAQPSALQQGIGLAGAAGSLFGGKAAGGAIKEYRQGGIVGYAPGGVIDSTRADLEQIAEMPDGMRRLEQIRNSSDSDAVRKMAAEIIAQKQIEAKVEQQTQQARMSGIAAAGGPAFESINMAGGGILAFANTTPGTDTEMPIKEDEDKFLSFEEKLKRAAAAPKKPFQYDSLASKLGQLPSKLGQFQPTKKQEESPIFTGNTEFDLKRQAEMEEQDVQKELGVDKILAKKEEKVAAKEGTSGTSGKAGTAAAKSKEYKDFLAELKEVGPKGQAGAEYEKYLTERLGKSGERLSRDERMAMAKGFLKFASTPAPGGIGQAAAAGLGEYATGIEAARKSQDTMEAEAQKARMELDKARRAEQRGDAAGAREAYDKYEDRMSRIQAAQIGAGAAGAPQRYTEQQIRNVMAENPGMSYGEAMTRVAGAGRMENVEVQRAKAALASIDESLGLMGKKDPRRAELEAQRAEIIRLLTPGGGVGGGQATQTSVVVPKDIQSILSKYPQR